MRFTHERTKMMLLTDATACCYCTVTAADFLCHLRHAHACACSCLRSTHAAEAFNSVALAALDGEFEASAAKRRWRNSRRDSCECAGNKRALSRRHAFIYEARVTRGIPFMILALAGQPHFCRLQLHRCSACSCTGSSTERTNTRFFSCCQRW